MVYQVVWEDREAFVVSCLNYYILKTHLNQNDKESPNSHKTTSRFLEILDTRAYQS